mmetsp:Transcript_21672/g.20791  ORF Transcript_21672/g.20791 Transcript_21672/m.20791 type:complete len:140 (+) Transcript_21672:244-663(+)
MDQTPLEETCCNAYLSYMNLKMPLKFPRKDFMDKMIRFVDFDEENPDGVFYCYYNSIPEEKGLALKTPQEGTDRANVIVGMQKVFRRPSDGKIVNQFLVQQDMKIIFTPVVVKMLVGSELKSWRSKMDKYINDNLDALD